MRPWSADGGVPAHGCRRQARRRADLLGSSHQACGKRVRASGDGATEAVCKDWRVQCGRVPHCLSPCLTPWCPGCAACSAYGIIIYMAKLIDSDWMTATQVFLFLFIYLFSFARFSGRDAATAWADYCGPMKARPQHRELPALFFTNSVRVL